MRNPHQVVGFFLLTKHAPTSVFLCASMCEFECALRLRINTALSRSNSGSSNLCAARTHLPFNPGFQSFKYTYCIYIFANIGCKNYIYSKLCSFHDYKMSLCQT